ncbi:hypothetical protein EDF62_3010 [Leucobacter luti]|uniref:Uncharacterized protein n=1 Tax=Leucobacter luti TaxID=340320 RepID=A0A4R6RTW7_9MICO|nr:SHOCT domain-containing protein [Leucobacter luti]TDP89715.1 hypothetical protein EDF62_3010 [Leucobacter luti]
MPFVPRFGRPGLIGLAARTAVVTGTATAVSGGLMAHQHKKAQTQYEAAQQQIAEPTARPSDLVTELQQLSELKSQGLLSDSEFEAAKTNY